MFVVESQCIVISQPTYSAVTVDRSMLLFVRLENLCQQACVLRLLPQRRTYNVVQTEIKKKKMQNLLLY